MTQVPIERSYWVEPGRFLAGAFPGHPDPQQATERIRAFLAAGIRSFVNLMFEDEVDHEDNLFVPYAPIVEREAVPVAAIEHRGDPARLGETLRTFIAWRREHRLHPSVSTTYNVVYDNPSDVPPEAFRMDICAATRAPVAPNAAGVAGKTLAGGRYAVLRHTGSDDTLGQSVAYLYADWLPASGEELRDAPLLFRRVRFYPDVPEHEAETDVLLPLR